MRRERERSGGGARTEMRIEKMPRFWPGICRGMPTEEGGGEGGGTGHLPFSSVNVDLCGRRRAVGRMSGPRPPRAPSPYSLFVSPLGFYLFFFSFPHPNHADAVTWTKLSPDPLRGFSFPLLRSYSSMKYSSGSIDSQRSTFDTTRFKAYTLYSENTITGLIAIKQRSHPFNYRIYYFFFYF